MKILYLALFSLVLMSCKSAKDFAFEKIIYHTSACFGRCATYDMEVSADRNIRLHSEKSYGKGMSSADESNIGYFKGKVSDSTFQRLILQLKTVQLDTLKFDGPNCCDAPIKTIIVYYNGKRKYLHAMFPPDHALPLIATLNDIYSTSKFVRSSNSFVIESDSIVPEK